MTTATQYTVALAGNPNCGKTTLFNALTGSAAYVGNWAGVTVEKKTGFTKDHRLLIVDLPGIYSLSPYSPEERAASRFLLETPPHVILNILDGTCPERSLYLTMQLLECGTPMVIAVNMADEMEKKGIIANWEALSKLLGVPFIPISAKTKKNLPLLADVVKAAAEKKLAQQPVIQYDRPTENALTAVSAYLRESRKEEPSIFSAACVLEGREPSDATLTKIRETYQTASRLPDPETALACARYGCAEEICRKAFMIPPARTTFSDRVDRLTTGRFTALPLFFLLMAGIFLFTFGPFGQACSRLLEGGFAGISQAVQGFLLGVHTSPWLVSWVVDGALGGVFAVLSFFPQIALLFFCLSILEDSGYMARAAFIADRPLRVFGLSGKSFIPLLMGFGCTAPAAMATRTIENEKSRRLTVFLTPFMSCGAKMPIYVLFSGLFFPQAQVLVIGLLYIGGVCMGILAGFILRRTAYRKMDTPFLMELPPYRLPSAAGIIKNVWEKCRGFLTKTFTVILTMSILIWFLQHFTPAFRYTADPSQGFLAEFGRMICPVFAPLGFGSWQQAVSLLAGFIAKENVLSTLLLACGGQAALLSAFSPASSLSFLTFVLLYLPCVAAMASIKNEVGFKSAFLAGALQTGFAWACAFFVFRVAGLFGL